MMSSVIVTRFGRGVDPFNPDPAQIHLDDIAWSLAHQCRFTGHCRAFYSVAQHSVLMANAIWWEHGEAAADYALLHDASEAYLTDIASPIKHHPEMHFYRAAERHLQAVIYQRFGLNLVEPACLKQADLRMLATEKRDLLAEAADVPWAPLPAPYPDQIVPLPPHSAYAELLKHLKHRFS